MQAKLYCPFPEGKVRVGGTPVCYYQKHYPLTSPRMAGSADCLPPTHIAGRCTVRSYRQTVCMLACCCYDVWSNIVMSLDLCVSSCQT